MDAIIRQRSVTLNGFQTAQILRELGIELKSPVKKHSGSTRYCTGFWEANGPELEYIYHDFKVKSHDLKKDLHPDKGGDTDKYAQLLEKIALVNRTFNKRGIGETRTPVQIFLDKQAKAEAHRIRTANNPLIKEGAKRRQELKRASQPKVVRVYKLSLERRLKARAYAKQWRDKQKLRLAA